MTIELRTNLGRRIFASDFKVFLMKKDSYNIVWASRLRKGDKIAWQSEKLVARKREFFYENLRKKDPELKGWLEEYERIGNFNASFLKCYEKISDEAPAVKILYELSHRMDAMNANATNPSTLASWMSEQPPWLPLDQGDLGKLAKSLRALATRHRVSGLKRQISRLERMSKSKKLRNLVARIRGRHRTIGRSIEEEPGKYKARSKRGKHFPGQKTREYAPARRQNVITAARQKAERDFESWLAEQPTDVRFDWATIKSRPVVTRSSGRQSDKGVGSSLGWYRSFRNGPVVAPSKGRVKKFWKALGKHQRRKRRRGQAPSGRGMVEVASGIEMPSPTFTEKEAQTGATNVTIPTETHLSLSPTIAQEKSPVAPAPSAVANERPQIKWTKLGFGLVELEVDSATPYEWSVPKSTTFDLLAESRTTEGKITKHRLEILPRERQVQIPESQLSMGVMSYPVDLVSFKFDDEVPDMGLSELRGSSREIRMAAEATLLSGLELMKYNPVGSVENSIRSLGLIRSVSPTSISEAAWKGVDTLRDEWNATPRRLVPNLAIAQWLFRTSLSGLRAIRASDQ
jgi:hypothetical protein